MARLRRAYTQALLERFRLPARALDYKPVMDYKSGQLGIQANTGGAILAEVSISADLSKSAEARSSAENIDPEEIPSRERRGRLGVEIARAYHQRRDYPAMLHWLEEAHRTSADSVRYSPSARQMAADAVDHGGALISRRARSLAGSVGLPL